MVNLSIIIPVYNVEDYLAVCLDSLLAVEGIDDEEIILVDDGSTDDTIKIEEDYSSKYQNIKVLHKDNGGPSAARNMGLEHAAGKYIFFCDSDDEVVPELFSNVLKLIRQTDVDMVMWDSDLIYETRSFFVNNRGGFFEHGGLEKTPKTYTGKQIIETLLENGGDLVAAVWLGAYRKDYLIGNKMFFEPGLIHEDELWVPKVMLNAKTVYYYPEKLYHYRIHKGSIMNPDPKGKKKHVDSLMRIYPSLYKYYDETLGECRLNELLEANLTKKYLHMIYKFNAVKYGYGKQIDKKLLWRTSRGLINKLMVMLLYVYAH